MHLANVVGNVVCTRKNEDMRGIKLLLVQPVDDHRQPHGRPLVAADSVGAGAGELVFYCTGREAALPFAPLSVAFDACIVGIVDSLHTVGSR